MVTKFYISRKLFFFFCSLILNQNVEEDSFAISPLPPLGAAGCLMGGASALVRSSPQQVLGTHTLLGAGDFSFIYIYFFIYQHFVRQTRVRSDERNKMSTSSGRKRCRSSRIWTTEIRKPKLECSLKGA